MDYKTYFLKIYKCIDSCENSSQLNACWRIIKNYKNLLLNKGIYYYYIHQFYSLEEDINIKLKKLKK